MKQLNFEKMIYLLKKYKINFVDYKIIKNEKDLNNIKYPIVMKVFSEKIVHKSDIGGIIINILNKEEASSAFEKIKKISNYAFVQPMVNGKEVIVGMKKDAQFGPVIMFGLGGIFVEVLKDVSFRICPVKKEDALAMIKEVKGYRILEGIRGEHCVDVDAIAELIVKVSNLSLKERVNEIDLNPVIVNEKNAIAVDARFMV